MQTRDQLPGAAMPPRMVPTPGTVSWATYPLVVQTVSAR